MVSSGHQEGNVGPPGETKGIELTAARGFPRPVAFPSAERNSPRRRLLARGRHFRKIDDAQSSPAEVTRLEWPENDLTGPRSGVLITIAASFHLRISRDH